MPRAAKEKSWWAGVLLATMLAGLAGGASSAEASIPTQEPRGVFLEQPVPLLEQAPLLEVPAGEPVDMATTGGERLPLFAPGPGPDGLFDGVRIPAVERFQAETRYRVIELEAQVRAELERLQTTERTGFALFSGGEPRRGSPNRYYDPELGRFISVDPLGYVDGPSMYGFAGYSPMNFGDPLGLSCFGLGPEEKSCTDYVPYFGIGYWTQQRGVLSAQTKDMSLTNKERIAAAVKVNAQIPVYLLEEGLRTLVLNLPHDLASARDEEERCAAVAGQFDPLGDFEGYFQAMEESGCSVVEGPGVAAIPVGPGRLKRLAKRSPTHARVVRNVEESAAATRSSRFGASVSRATGALDDLLQGGRQVSGRFPRTAGPNEVLFRRDAAGRVTHYQIFDEQGLPLRRVDVTGKAHGEIPTPHVLEFERHANPTTGETFVKPGPVRPALPEEIP